MLAVAGTALGLSILQALGVLEHLLPRNHHAWLTVEYPTASHVRCELITRLEQQHCHVDSKGGRMNVNNGLLEERFEVRWRAPQKNNAVERTMSALVGDSSHAASWTIEERAGLRRAAAPERPHEERWCATSRVLRADVQRRRGALQVRGCGHTNSGSALTEAIHSSADCMNQLLLLIGNRAASNRADEQHPLVFGRETHFYALLVALQIFLVGGVASVAVGVVRLLHHSSLEHPYVVIGVLCVAGVIEASALRASISTIDRSRRKTGLWKWFRETGRPLLLLTIGEDVAALAGVLASLVAVVLSVLTGSPVFDACGSIAVGLILISTVIFSMREIKSLIVGEAAHQHVRQAMHAWLARRPEIQRVVSLIVLKWADDLVVAIQAELRPHERPTISCAPSMRSKMT